MIEPMRQQIIISGVGGQGVLFVTRLLAEAAIGQGLPVFTSETHGMAQRGGTVGGFLKAGGWAVVNGQNDSMPDVDIPADIVDADTVAQKIKNPKSINLIVLGFALATAEQAGGNQDSLFCNFEDIKAVLKDRFSKNKKIMLDASMKALQAGYNAESVK
jgi:indolepyruvate ferredoxin oxidoreductase beta subunit